MPRRPTLIATGFALLVALSEITGTAAHHSSVGRRHAHHSYRRRDVAATVNAGDVSVNASVGDNGANVSVDSNKNTDANAATDSTQPPPAPVPGNGGSYPGGGSPPPPSNGGSGGPGGSGSGGGGGRGGGGGGGRGGGGGPYGGGKGGSCQFPTDAGLVAVTPDKANGGWALPPDQPCKPGMYCPYACPAGQLSVQWDPKATAYTYPQSMNGGLYCDMSGNIQKPFPDKPYCLDGHGTFLAESSCEGEVAICQTVLPGREDMLIPTSVTDGPATLAVPGLEYWAKTAAHFYINPPGVSVADGCIWGDVSKPHGNWSPYVAGANVVENGDTFTKIGWNPIYLEPTCSFRNKKPEFGVRIECEGSGCNGLPCEIDPSKHNVNEVTGGGGGAGAGGANFCVVTVSKGSKAKLVIFPVGGAPGKSAAQAPAPPPIPSAPYVPTEEAPAPANSSSSAASTYSASSSSEEATPTPLNYQALVYNGTYSSSSSSANPVSTGGSTSYGAPPAPPSSAAAALPQPSEQVAKASSVSFSMFMVMCGSLLSLFPILVL